MSHRNSLALYLKVRPQIQPGDIIAFGGKSLFSRWAKFTTQSSVTHVGVVLHSQMVGDSSGRYFNQIIESTQMGDSSGVMINRLRDRIATYDGDIWWLPLSTDARATLDKNRQVYFNFLLKQEYKPYDIAQLFGAAVDWKKDQGLLRELTHNDEAFCRWFCSELTAEALEKAGVLSKVNASEVTPVDMCRFAIYQHNYVQLAGEPRHIEGYNSLPGHNFGNVEDANREESPRQVLRRILKL